MANDFATVMRLVLYSIIVIVCIYFCANIHLRFKHAILGTQLSYLDCLSRTMRDKKWVSRPHLPIWPLQTHSRMEGRKEMFYLTEGRKEMVYLTMHSTHFIYGYMVHTFYLWLYGAGCSELELAPRC